MSKSKQISQEAYAIITETIEAFCEQYGIDLQIFGDQRSHWRLTGLAATLDCWPVTGKYWIKDVPLGLGFSIDDRSGHLPQSYIKLDKFLKALFNV